MFARGENVAAVRAALRRAHSGFDFVEDETLTVDTIETRDTLIKVCRSLGPSLIRSGLRASTTDHPEQGIRE